MSYERNEERRSANHARPIDPDAMASVLFLLEGTLSDICESIPRLNVHSREIHDMEFGLRSLMMNRTIEAQLYALATALQEVIRKDREHA